MGKTVETKETETKKEVVEVSKDDLLSIKTFFEKYHSGGKMLSEDYVKERYDIYKLVYYLLNGVRIL